MAKSNKRPYFRINRRQSRILSRSSGRVRPRGHDQSAAKVLGPPLSAPTPQDTKFGAVEQYHEAVKCAELFRARRDEIDGIVVTLPNFGDERGIADTLRLADLNVPVLVQATPDTPSKMSIRDRRDSFCGKMSACNNLMQYGIPYSLTTLHTETPQSSEFQEGPRMVHGRVPRCERAQAAARRLHRRAAAGIQHRPLQREATGACRHFN